MAMRNYRNSLTVFLGLFLLVQTSGLLYGAAFAVKVVDKEPPQEIDGSIRKTVQGNAVQILENEKPIYEFWFSAALPLQSKPELVGKGLDTIKQTTLLGVVAVHGDKHDYKDNDLPSGIYTIRFAMQPQDGNHLGTAEFSYFAVLIRSKNDSKLDGISDYKALVKASSKETSSDHPIILSLRPTSSGDGNLPALSDPVPDHKCVRVRVPASLFGADEKISIVFDLVYKGIGKI